MGHDTNKRKHCLRYVPLFLWRGDPGARWAPGSRSLTATYAPYFLSAVLDGLLAIAAVVLSVAVGAILLVPSLLLWLAATGALIVGTCLPQLILAGGASPWP